MEPTPGLTYLQPMQCEKCGEVIRIKEQEESTVVVNAKGLPVNSEVTEFSVIGECPKCGKTYKVEKDGMYFSLYNRTLKRCPHLKTKELEELRVKIGWEI